MGNRKQPFGYQISSGKVSVNKIEADTVRWVFERYMVGVSYRGLVVELEKRGVPYDCDRHWNKNMVARILADERYVGAAGYPIIMNAELFQGAAHKRPSCGRLHNENEDVKVIRPLVRCAACGEKLVRKDRQIRREHWTCPNCGGMPENCITPMLVKVIIQSLNGLIQNPKQLHSLEPPFNAGEARRIQAELNAEMNLAAVSFDTAKACSLTFALAATRFEELGFSEYETHRLRRLLEDSPPSKTLDNVLLREVISAIQISLNGEIRLKLKNGQVIGEESVT